MEICNREDRLYDVPRGKASRLVENGEKLRREKVSTLQELIDALHEAFETDHVNIDHVQDLMMSYKSNPTEWKKFAKFDRYRYTRNLVDEGNGRFNLMVLCWGEGHGSAIHDHANAHCVMKVLQGKQLLCLKRHQKSSHMPGLYVFPGGTVDSADANLKWREHFATFGLDNDRFASLVPRTPSRPQIFRSRENELLREVSLRITAIRETFEECGILICRRDLGSGASAGGWAEHLSIPQDELRTWQSKVHNDATEFFNLCQRLECYPDLWALREWRNWLTPTTVYEKRYNTAFYLTCMPYVPHAEYDDAEMEDLKWDTPEKLCSMGITFPPPQQSEIAKLTKIKNIDHLLDIAVERNREGMQLYLPVRMHMKDGIVHVLPGDTMYPKEVSLLEKQLIDKSDITVDEFERITPVKNRTEFFDTKVNVIFTDNGEDNHVAFPMAGQISKIYGDEETKNKL